MAHSNVIYDLSLKIKLVVARLVVPTIYITIPFIGEEFINNFLYLYLVIIIILAFITTILIAKIFDKENRKVSLLLLLIITPVFLNILIACIHYFYTCSLYEDRVPHDAYGIFIVGLLLSDVPMFLFSLIVLLVINFIKKGLGTKGNERSEVRS